jgi:hypothetical protein
MNAMQRQLPRRSLQRVDVSLDALRIENDGPGVYATTTLHVGDRVHPIHMRVRGGLPTDRPDTLFAMGLLPAMRMGYRLRIPGSVSARLAGSATAIQDLLGPWSEGALHRVQLECSTSPVQDPPGIGVASFFSGGLDSFYTLLKHREEITSLILIHGFDIPLANRALWARTASAARLVADHFGKGLIEVETNFPEVIQRYVVWDLAHGAALAAVGLLLSPGLRRIYIPASMGGESVEPAGTHPDLDHLWSTEVTEFVHDGCEATRVDKAAAISQCDIALNTLRVCYENPNGAYNCGVCEKCLRTMVNLQAVGALERCSTFDRPLNLDSVALMDSDHQCSRWHLLDNLHALEGSGAQPQLAAALRKALGRSDRVKAFLRPGLARRVVTLQLPRQLLLDRYNGHKYGTSPSVVFGLYDRLRGRHQG